MSININTESNSDYFNELYPESDHHNQNHHLNSTDVTDVVVQFGSRAYDVAEGHIKAACLSTDRKPVFVSTHDQEATPLVKPVCETFLKRNAEDDIEIEVVEEEESPSRAKYARIAFPEASRQALEPIQLLRRHRMDLTSHDLRTLSDQHYLNDQIIDFWLLDLHSRLNIDELNRTHIFSTFFYKKLTGEVVSGRRRETYTASSSERHSRVKNWTRRIDLFKKDFIIMPVVEDAHWYVAIVCYPDLVKIRHLDNTDAPDENTNIHESKKTIITTSAAFAQTSSTENKMTSDQDRPLVNQPCIFIFDSLLRDKEHIEICTKIRQYLEAEYLEKRKISREFNMYNMPGFIPPVPQQPNLWDCGIYLISYVEAFFYKPIHLIVPMKQANWFSSAVVDTKRKEIFEKIAEYIKTDHPEKVAKIPKIKFSPSSKIKHKKVV